jgi:hypothetical protein
MCAAIRYGLGRTIKSADVAVLEASSFEEFVDTALTQGARTRKKDGHYFCAAMKGGKRAKGNAEPLSILALDFDKLGSDAELTRLMEEAQAWQCFGYTTASHSPADGRYKARLLFALDRPATAAEYPLVAHAVTGELARRAGIALDADAAVMKLEQPVYTLRAGASIWKHFDGPPVAVAKAARINGNADNRSLQATGHAEGERIPEGKRNATLTALAGALRRHGMSHAGIEAALLAENRRCAPEPLPEAEVKRIASSIAKYEPGHVAHVLRGMGVPVPERLPAPAPVTAASLLKMEFRPLSWCVPDILPEGVFILAARPKIGKSWLAAQISIAVGKKDGEVLGRQAAHGAVLYLALEDNQRRLKSRLVKLGAQGVQGVEFACEWPRADQGGLEALLAWCEARPDARLVVVDTLQRFRPRRNGRGSDIYAEDYEALALFKTLAERHRVTVLIVHHTRKAEAEDPMDLVSGTLGLGGAADGVIVLKRDRGQERAELHLIGRDVENEGAFVVEFRRASCTWHLIGDAAVVGTSDAQTAILAALRDAPGALTAGEVAEELSRNRVTVRRLLRKLAKAGKVVQDGKHRYTVSREQGEQREQLPENRANA